LGFSGDRPIKAMAPSFRLGQAMFLAAGIFTAACSDDTGGDTDSGAPRSDATSDASASDVSTDDASSDGASTDASLDVGAFDVVLDASSNDIAADGDGGCACTLVDSGLGAPLPANGIMSLPCYCAMPWPGIPGAAQCASYEVATRCDGRRTDISVETYTNCNLITLRYGNNLGPDARVYDHTTHELVGAYRGTDHSLPCGTSQAFMIFSGTVPGAECQTAKIEWPCEDAGRDDGGAEDVADATSPKDGPPPDEAAPPKDAAAPDGATIPDADGGCACEPDERDRVGWLSLPCYCARGCRTYDQALTACNSDSLPQYNRVEDYEACNLVVMTFGSSIPGGGVYVFDRTTHDLVGASGSADYPAFECNDASVFGYRAGKFPPPECAVSRSVPRCPRDGG
jgi:hypothetical protein